MKVAVIYGGRSGEHEISLISAAAIARGASERHDVVLIGIARNGAWDVQDGAELRRVLENPDVPFNEIEEIEENRVRIVPGAGTAAFSTASGAVPVDVAFPALHGSYGEDGTIQGLLEMLGVPYVGCTTLGSALTMDKEKTKQILAQSGIPVVPYRCMKRCDLLDSNRYDELFQNAVDELGFPLFVKPCCAGSSNGAAKAETPKQLSYALMEAFRWDDKVLIETAVNAREIECSVTGNAATAPADSDIEAVRAFVPGEIIPTHEFYDYDAKYTDPDGAGLRIPADLPADMIETVRSTAVKAYKALDLTGLSRVDFLLDKDSGALYLNEINTMPGFTPISMFPKMCGAAGLPFGQLVDLLIAEARAQFAAKSALQTSR
ncbi:MAG: D-alanine--D-alanine ligase [Treponemataceae bacterium]|nr:D-alanine--D-alanine ligase [Treponemataceae bacterium]